MRKKKIGKKEVYRIKYTNLLKNFQYNSSKCIKNGVIIAPECVVYDSKWRIVIEKRDKDDNVKDRKLSDPKFYYKAEDYEIKIMEITAFYAESF